MYFYFYFSTLNNDRQIFHTNSYNTFLLRNPVVSLGPGTCASSFFTLCCSKKDLGFQIWLFESLICYARFKGRP